MTRKLGSNKGGPPERYRRSLASVEELGERGFANVQSSNVSSTCSGNETVNSTDSMEGALTPDRECIKYVYGNACCLRFTTSEDEDDREVIEGCSNRKMHYHSEGEGFVIWNGVENHQGGKLIVRDLDETIRGE